MSGSVYYMQMHGSTLKPHAVPWRAMKASYNTSAGAPQRRDLQGEHAMCENSPSI